MQTLPWIVAFVSTTLLAALFGAWAWRTQERRKEEALPTDWPLTARTVFSADERRVYRSLREALPHHVLLSKLPLVRFCQPIEPSEALYWRDLLGTSQVSFAVCSANGRVLAALDLDGERQGSRRMLEIKQAALGACRVRYLRCAADELPSIAELQMWVPGSGSESRAPLPNGPARPAPQTAPLQPPVGASPLRGSPRPVLWRDTTAFQDSFFPSDDGFEDSSSEMFEPAAGRRAAMPQRSTESRRRARDTVDFEPTRQIFEDDADGEDDDARETAARRNGRMPRFKPESRS